MFALYTNYGFALLLRMDQFVCGCVCDSLTSLLDSLLAYPNVPDIVLAFPAGWLIAKNVHQTFF